MDNSTPKQEPKTPNSPAQGKLLKTEKSSPTHSTSTQLQLPQATHALALVSPGPQSTPTPRIRTPSSYRPMLGEQMVEYAAALGRSGVLTQTTNSNPALPPTPNPRVDTGSNYRAMLRQQIANHAASLGQSGTQNSELDSMSGLSDKGEDNHMQSSKLPQAAPHPQQDQVDRSQVPMPSPPILKSSHENRQQRSFSEQQQAESGMGVRNMESTPSTTDVRDFASEGGRERKRRKLNAESETDDDAVVRSNTREGEDEE